MNSLLYKKTLVSYSNQSSLSSGKEGDEGELM